MSIAKASIKKVSWEEVRKRISKVNPELAQIIDTIGPDKKHYLYLASYPFGAEILKDGILHVPNQDGNLVPLTDAQVPETLQRDLGYNLNSNPICLILKHSTELFIKMDDLLITHYGAITEGRVFGTSRILSPDKTEQPIFIWNMTAGARSLFMLPKISEKGRHNRLARTFDLNMEPPKSHLDHWAIFKELAQHPDFGEAWQFETVFFPQAWVDALGEPNWQQLKLFLFDVSWDNTEFMRSQFIWDAMISIFHKNRNISPDPYLSSTVQTLLFVGAGWNPGFSVATDDSSGPIKRLQELYLDVYRLNDYAPIIMQPSSFSLKVNQPVYYSLAYPIATKLLPRYKTEVNKLSDLYNIRSLLMKYFHDIRSMPLNITGTSMYELPVKVEYEFFHASPEGHTGIQACSEIPRHDPYLKKIARGAERHFPTNSSFLNGCIRVRAKP